MNHSYDIETSKERLTKDIEALHNIHPMSPETFLAGKVIPPVSIAREYNKSICRMHVIMKDIRNNLKTFPHLKKQVHELLHNQKYTKILNTSTSEITQVIMSLKENCLHTFTEYLSNLESHNDDQSGSSYSS